MMPWTRISDAHARQRHYRGTHEARYRDGDQCRYCGQPVLWHRTLHGPPANSGRYVQLPAGGLVVACNSCVRLGEQADMGMVLLPPPTTPVYTERTRAWLAAIGYPVGDGR